MNHRHRKVLHALFAHPVSANIHANDVEAVLTELGAELDHTHHGKLMVRLNGQALALPHTGHTLVPEQVRQLRRFLESCSCAGSSRAAASTPAPTRPDRSSIRGDRSWKAAYNDMISKVVMRRLP